MTTQPATQDFYQAVSYFRLVKESIRYCFPLHWGNVEHTLRRGTGHCGIKAEVLTSELRMLGYRCRYVIGHDVKVLPKFLIPGFLNMHIWVEVLIDSKWILFDPSPDGSMVPLVGNSKPGMHLFDPGYTVTMEDIPPWYKDVYNNWSALPNKLLVNVIIAIVKWWLKTFKKRSSHSLS